MSCWLLSQPFLQLVKLITQTVKTKKYKVDSKLFDTLLYLNLHDVTVGKQSEVNNYNKKLRKDVTTMSKKEKKRMKSVVKLQRELKEAEAVESKEKRTKLVKNIFNVWILTWVMYTVFFIANGNFEVSVFYLFSCLKV